MSNAQNPKPAPFLIAGLAMVSLSGGVFYLLLQPEPNHELAPPVPETARVANASPSRSHAAEANPATVERDPSPGAAKSSTTSNRMARDLERERIWEALSERHGLQPAAEGSAAPSPSAATLLPTLDREYIREVIKEQLVPVAIDCYNTVLSEDRQGGGTVNLKFTIIGSEEIGGIVEDAEIGPGSTFTSAFMQECLRESTMMLTFDPPPEGGRMEVNYPLTFEPGDDDD